MSGALTKMNPEELLGQVDSVYSAFLKHNAEQVSRGSLDWRNPMEALAIRLGNLAQYD